ncbi:MULTISPECIES: SDR family oxidoreductase [Mesonia]|uniref:UDP-N-acetylglucosamine 4-epimerase n=1 Tax=Mesonia oceanica TaxID=2687242 RepID=A0AC61Y735_9FLAO|nr:MULTISPECIES: SDR family oxidoreductase [Mesonia]MAN28960.1 LPS biosynthesis protein WbpP [Mesonia sp.]MAQ42740.1 LPS biosynthesis protein WbpP [Mesonia sp.]MBJ99278.1 LPS biosynthesis protein WbpP [Flavobacteriaceae bacterium]VVU99722.1 UDP-N-acetylglucosamine 4-epimerase [Mesonia oceanica]|tara:strand:- start:33118 stop:34122 length:1005 start_codon:yes stop_codon:yes gene_type:complete
MIQIPSVDTGKLKDKTILVTGGAGFIGSNLCEYLVDNHAIVRCLDNFATGHRKNIQHLLEKENFTLIEGDIRDLATCQKACGGVNYILHEAALGSVPRSIEDPLTSNEVNVNGFLNMLVAARDQEVKRFVYAASSSTYGDSKTLPKEEAVIGKPLSPYAITKYVNELYADNFKRTYNLDTIGLRYFNVFGRKQDPNGAYAAVIPKFVMQFMKYESPVINGDGTYSRDFTYIDNVIQMNMLAITTGNQDALNEVYNTAVGDRTMIKAMAEQLRDFLSEYDAKIAEVEIKHGPNRQGDIPHSLASIAKAQQKMNYQPTHTFGEGLKEAVKWYWENL